MSEAFHACLGMGWQRKQSASMIAAVVIVKGAIVLHAGILLEMQALGGV